MRPSFDAGWENDRFMVVRSAFTWPLVWKGMRELLRRGTYVIEDRKRHWFWEWVSITKKQ